MYTTLHYLHTRHLGSFQPDIFAEVVHSCYAQRNTELHVIKQFLDRELGRPKYVAASELIVRSVDFA